MFSSAEIPGAIGVFDSGYGGLTILEQFRKMLPEYDYIYLGDNARTPYGSRSFEIVYEFTWQAVSRLFDMGCHLVILACNTASAKALRSIQQLNLPKVAPGNRVLGIIRPTVEILDQLTQTKHVGLLGTEGTIRSRSYPMEVKKLFPHIYLAEEACPMWVSLVENREYDQPGADYFIKKNLDNLMQKDPSIDTVILGCTHYPLLADKIRAFLPPSVRMVSQGEYVAESLRDYLLRHPEIDKMCTRNGSCTFYTTESEETFCRSAAIFLKEKIQATTLVLN